MSSAFVKRSVRLTLKPDVSSEQLGKVLAEIYRLSGCLACGIRGIDVILHGGDPELAGLGKLAGVDHAAINQFG